MKKEGSRGAADFGHYHRFGRCGEPGRTHEEERRTKKKTEEPLGVIGKKLWKKNGRYVMMGKTRLSGAAARVLSTPGVDVQDNRRQVSEKGGYGEIEDHGFAVSSGRACSCQYCLRS